MRKQAKESTISFTASVKVKVSTKGIRINSNVEPSEYLLAATREAEVEHKAGTTTTISDKDELATHLANLKN